MHCGTDLLYVKATGKGEYIIMALDYTVGNPRLDTEISDTGTGFIKVWEVPYTITKGPAQGTKGVVRIPADEYSADSVHATIGQAVGIHQQVLGYTGV
jgi:hypothetical protein